MVETTIEYLKRRLESEVQSQGLLPLPTDFYSAISNYSQKLKRSAVSGASEVSVRLIATQGRMLESMLRQLVDLRLKKAMQQNAAIQLLPEERYICSAEQRFRKRLDSFVDAVSGGRPSFVEFASLSETRRNITVRFLKKVDELVGLDLRRYGPFEVEDVASIPAANADILIAGGDAVEIYTRDEM
ncbi:MAG: DNA replication complex GINS family protein [Nitrososphaerota archaeon]|nr:DNA replication complex GINS family protein [Nitrososphaerota archaeon]